MNVIRFKLPANFEPKCKAYRRSHRRVPRSAHITPDTLFSLCELALRKLLAPRVPRKKFWATVLALLPGTESRKVAVRHQVEHPLDYNAQQRSVVNDANHWELLTESLRHEPRWPRIRIGDSGRNRITRLHQDYPPQQIWQIRPYDMLTSAFIVRTAARIASLEQQRSLVRNRGRTLTTATTTATSSRRLSRAPSMDVPTDDDDAYLRRLQPLMVIGKRATAGSCKQRLASVPVKANRRKKPTR
ncbi:uncharacterized protein LOC131212344 [Anopheles bellator]|uniref:uncharacterized protein LOC131212344 n=1 Tax=Anopheles bellator TaxID=139047 RepID=UPI0026491D5D|nr:uncharacterized protein LOC131212344 [Anopheles bellator]